MNRLLALLLALAPPLAAQAGAAPDTARWTVVMGGRDAGYLKGWTMPDGELRYRSTFNDRGRGPDLTARVRLNARGLPVWEETTGVDYLKTPVTETFAATATRATWTNQAEHGDQPAPAAAWYVPLNDALDPALLARALLAAPGHTLALLPAGQARLERAGELRVSAGGRSRTVVQYLVTGMGFEPDALWLTPEGRFFARGGGFLMTIEKGWEDAIPALTRAQDSTAGLRYAEMARTLARRPAHALAFRHVAVFDAESRTRRADMTVVVSGSAVQAVGPEGTVTVPADAEEVDGRGRTLLPGLWDMHVHLGRLDGVLNLAAGVTSVRDMGNDTTSLLQLRSAWNEGREIGPRVMIAGFIDGPGPFTGPTGLKVSTAAEARAAVDAYARLGAEQIKVYSSLDTALLPGIIARAHQLRLRVSGHIPWHLSAAQGVREGMDEIQHANFLVLNFLGDSIDTRTPARFTAPARMAASLDLASPEVQSFVALLRERGTVLDPTLTAFEGLMMARNGQVSPTYASVVERFPPNVQRSVRTGGLPVPAGMDERYRASFAKMVEMVGMLHRAGVRIVPGTDGLCGFDLHRELEQYVAAGIPPAEVLYLATLGAARVMKHDDRLGSVAPGRLADLVLVEGDPTTRISDVRRAVMVVKDGTVYDPARLYAAIGVAAPN